MTADSSNPPRVFISYAWTSSIHQAWVVNLATSLRNDGIDVVLDVWDLKPGQDKYHFMERMVAEPSLARVLMVCNSVYASKADDRAGGVGDETQIITPSMYANTANEKFIPVLAELDQDGKPFLPSYLKTRIYIDLSSDQIFQEGYEQLLRLIHGAPAFPKPPLGRKPGFLEENVATASATSPLLRRAVHAVSEDKRTAVGLVSDYLDALSDALLALRFQPDGSRPVDEDVFDAIRRSKAYRDEYLELLESLCRFGRRDVIEKLLLGFFEATLSGTTHHGSGSWNDAEFDGIRFALMELFLYTVALLLARDETGLLKLLLVEPYVYRDRGTQKKTSYGALWSPVESIERNRQQRTNSNRISLIADLIKDRADRRVPSFEQIQEADFLLYLRTHFVRTPSAYWFPRTLLYLGHSPAPFEIFIAPESKKRRARLETMLDLRNDEDLRTRFEAVFPDPRSRRLSVSSHWPLSIGSLMNLESLD